MMAARARRDLPSLLLELGVLVLGSGRPEWGRAMTSELARLEGRRARWEFALGCVRSIAFGMPPAGTQRVITAGSLLAAVTSVGIVAFALVRFPGLVTGAGTWVLLGAFVTVLLAYLVAAANLGALLVDARRLVTPVATGLAIASTWLALGLDASLGGPAALSGVLLGSGVLVAVAIGWLATARSGSSRVGVGQVGLTALVAGFVVFLLWAGSAVAAAGRPYDAGLLRDFRTSGAPDLATYAVDDALGAGMMLLLLVPLVTLAAGLVGTAVAVARRR